MQKCAIVRLCVLVTSLMLQMDLRDARGSWDLVRKATAEDPPMRPALEVSASEKRVEK
jgi:hypothetical protein